MRNHFSPIQRKLIYPIFLLLFSTLFLWGCEPPKEVVSKELFSSNGNFVLYVSNQSTFFRHADITVYIDGKCVVNQDFDTKDQHNWISFTLRIAPGKHEITAVSKNGKARLTKTFYVIEKHWVIIDYLNAGPADLKSKPHFSFSIRDKPIMFR